MIVINIPIVLMVIKDLKNQMNLLIPMKLRLSMLVTMSMPILIPMTNDNDNTHIIGGDVVRIIESNDVDVHESLASLINI